MATTNLARERPAFDRPLARPFELVCIALVFTHAIYLAATWWQGLWILDPAGQGVASDFVNVWAAGHLTRDGLPAVAYDWPAHKAVEAFAVGHDFDGYFGWHYPPPFLAVAALLAMVPYALSYALWQAITFPLYLAAIRAIIGETSGWLLAAAFPAVLSNFVVGQNGFLTTALIGGTLHFLTRRPALAGVLLGLLTYKPHLGLLFPLVLVVGGHWRTIMVASVVAVAMATGSWLAFGTQTWIAFVQSIPHTSQAFLSDGWADWGKLQTVFGVVRSLGGSETIAWSAHAALALTTATVVCVIWRMRCANEVKSAALATGALLVTPYLYTYDLVALAVPFAFLYRLGRRDGFRPLEWATYAFAAILIMSFPFVTAPVGFAAVLLVAGLVVHRAFGRRTFGRRAWAGRSDGAMA